MMQALFGRNQLLPTGLTLLLAGCAQTATTPSELSTPSEPSTGSIQRHNAQFLLPMFSILDCEGVGAIESGEVDEHFHDVYFYIDRDQSRGIVLEELTRGAHLDDKVATAELFAAMDENADASLTPMEYRRYLIRAIDGADRDGNGKVSRAELSQAAQ